MISIESARTIASYWQSSGTHGIGMAQFASTGTVTDSLFDDIARESDATDSALDRTELAQLLEYVRSLSVAAWSVGHNTAGYLPESSPSLFLDYADAVEAYTDMLGEAPDMLASDDCECGGDELCEYHAIEAHVKSYIRDGVPWIIRPSVHAVNPHGGTARELAFSVRPDSAALPTEFFLARTEVNVADYLARKS